MIARIKTLAAATLVAAAFAGPAMAAGEGVEIQAQDWSFGGIFGAFDRAELQRGFQVYQDVCSTCHSLKHVAYRSEEHTSELQSLMRISYAVFCLKKKNN